MSHFNLALIGFGNVGRELASLLIKKEEEIRHNYGVTYTVTGITTGSHGRAIDPGGIDLQIALDTTAHQNKDRARSLNDLSFGKPPANSPEFIRMCEADVLFENSPVNYSTGQPALDHFRLALDLGMHVITANKGPVVHAYQELTELARARNVKFYFESTVMDGAPVFGIFRDTLPTANLKSLRGILNSTTNMILSRMESGMEFEDAVTYAQQIGIAETDPSGDVDGWDAAIKVAALTTVLMGIPIKPQAVDREGIRAITLADIEQARREGKRWKLLCTASLEGDRVVARVAPELVTPDTPFYLVEGTTSLIQFESDVLGRMTIIEEDPGPHTTAYGCLADFINAVR